MSETVTVAYSADGPIAELEVTDPAQGGRSIGTVKRGETIDVPQNVADDLVQREDFTKPEPKAAPAQAQKDSK